MWRMFPAIVACLLTCLPPQLCASPPSERPWGGDVQHGLLRLRGGHSGAAAEKEVVIGGGHAIGKDFREHEHMV